MRLVRAKVLASTGGPVTYFGLPKFVIASDLQGNDILTLFMLLMIDDDFLCVISRETEWLLAAGVVRNMGGVSLSPLYI